MPNSTAAIAHSTEFPGNNANFSLCEYSLSFASNASPIVRYSPVIHSPLYTPTPSMAKSPNYSGFSIQRYSPSICSMRLFNSATFMLISFRCKTILALLFIFAS
ncbi:hypothetical protein SteCoe_33960 [Stentor coeruleus]|uniref:Uncharacterized protein n=1 Tax=Stentor coeruleus TaxID=5963 RepID=A0A1R2AVS9_9CILI|nr:hypothetical protein SteCoe_33960 [Stentor coeruleus]